MTKKKYEYKTMAGLLAKKERWCQYAVAKDRSGNRLMDVNHPEACQWCILGAMEKVYGDRYHDTVCKKIRESLEELFPRLVELPLGQVNDSYLWHGDIVKVLKKARV